MSDNAEVVAHTPPNSDDIHVGDRHGCEACADWPTPTAPEPGTGTRDALAAVLRQHELALAETAGWRCRCGFLGAWYEQHKHLAAALAPEVARIEAEAEQRGREDNAEHAMCYVHGSKALEARLAEEREAGQEQAGARMNENEADMGEALSTADIARLGDAVLTDDAGVAVGFDHLVVTRLVGRALANAADDVERECTHQSGPCFCGSADWLRARAARIARSRP